MLYQLMNKDVVVATYEERMGLDEYYYDLVERFDSYVPYSFIDINDWIDGRQIAKHRTSIEKLMRELGLTTRHDFIGMVRCLSLTDTFWMKREDEPLIWDDVSLYRNPFDDAIARAVMTPDIKAKLIELKDFEYTDPGFDYPCWKLDAVNRLKDRQIKLLLE